MPRAKSDVAKHSAVLAQSDFPFGAAIQVIEHRFRHPLARDRTKILDANNSGRSHCAGRSSHSCIPPVSRNCLRTLKQADVTTGRKYQGREFFRLFEAGKSQLTLIVQTDDNPLTTAPDVRPSMAVARKLIVRGSR